MLTVFFDEALQLATSAEKAAWVVDWRSRSWVAKRRIKGEQ